MLKRREYLVDLTDPNRDLVQDGRFEVHDGTGNLWSSQLAGQNYHCPTLDIDLECELYESSTPGHFHLYIDKPMKWQDYVYLLEALEAAGIIQRGYMELSIARGASFLRKPGVEKGPNDAGDS